jgi:hypothetical protein
MSRRQKDPLRLLNEAERTSLSRLSRSQSAPAAQVARARALLAVAEGGVVQNVPISGNTGNR